MNRTLTNLIVDLSAVLLLIGMLATGWILRFPLPPGTNKTLALWGLTRHQWGGFHTWISIGLLAVLSVHVVLHWQWLSSVIAKRLKMKGDTPDLRRRWGAISLAFFVMFLVAFGWATYRGVVPTASTSETELTEGVHVNRHDLATDTLSSDFEVPSERQGRVSFRKEVLPILDRSCAPCHSQQQANSGFRIDEEASYFGPNAESAIIVPGKAEESPLITIVSGHKKGMPLASKHRLPDSEVTVLRKWINEGAQFADARD